MNKIAVLVIAAAVSSLSSAAFAQYSPRDTYANPDSTSTQAFQTSRKVCSDTWVTIAAERVFGRGFDPVHCDKRNFNNGQWTDYNQLVHAVGAYKADIDGQRVAFYAAVVNGETKVLVASQGKPQFLANPADLGLQVQAPGKLVAAGGGNLVAAGGGNLVAAGGGNLVAAGGGNLVAAGGGNVMTGLPGANFGTRAPLSGPTVRLGSRLAFPR